MSKIFCSPKSAFPSSAETIDFVLRNHFNIQSYQIVKNEVGKPFLKLSPSLGKLFFSVTHTDDFYFIAFANENIGIDAEPLSRQIDYLPIVSKFDDRERETIKNSIDFLKNWTIKESAIKWLGGTIARDLKKLSFHNEKLFYQGLELPCKLYQTEIRSHAVCVCSDAIRNWTIISI